MASCRSPLEATPELDLKGIDALINLSNNLRIGLQIKKETYRSEARGENRFLKGQKAHALLEVPYTLQSEQALIQKTENARSRAELYNLWAKVAKHLEHLPNGFVIFKESYVQSVERFLQEHGSTLSGRISWERVAKEVLS